MNIYKKNNVYDEAKKRIAFLFDEFETIVVGMSGGKDSTVVYNLCLEEAEKRGRLPLSVLWIDQEAEWQGTVDYVKSIMYNEKVKPYWLQCPIRLFNATSHKGDNWLNCWKDGENWIREKDPISIHENSYGTDRFHDMFPAFVKGTFSDTSKVCIVGGVRAEESPQRRLGLTNQAKYKWVTWGKRQNGIYVFYPIYDWSYTDIWHAICVNKWRYNKVYDEYYKRGVPVLNMRISNLNHETAVKDLYFVQEIEPDTWNKFVDRMDGVHVIGHIEYKDNFTNQKKLPFMFKDWKEYRDHLLKNLIVDPKQRETFKKKFEECEKQILGTNEAMDTLYRVEISCMLANDWTFTKLDNHMAMCDSTKTVMGQIKNGRTIRKSKNNEKLLEEIL